MILETGGNSPGYSWLLLQSKMAVFTRVCWYDRAGVGWSDPPSSPRTSASVASDLQEALQRAGVLPPYVMAGGSVGGEYVHIYTARYPSDVAGLVLIDSAVPDMHEPDFALAPLNRMSGRTRHLICMALPGSGRCAPRHGGIARLYGHRSAAGSRRSTQQEITDRSTKPSKALEPPTASSHSFRLLIAEIAAFSGSYHGHRGSECQLLQTRRLHVLAARSLSLTAMLRQLV